MFKKIIIIFILCLLCKISFAKTETFKIQTYPLQLNSVELNPGETYTENIDIDSIKYKIPSQILTTVETGNWIYNLPNSIFVTFGSSSITDKIIEHWDVSFASVKQGKVLFIRTITNNDTIIRNSYEWNIKVKCFYNKISQ